MIGDWGYGSTAEARILARICQLDRTSRLAFVLTVGDNFYRPDGRATAANYGRPAACLVRARVPWRAVWGNHDLGGDATATVLGARRHWYRFRAGPALIVVLDANHPTDPAQLAFMRHAIPAHPRGPVIVAFHQPLQSAGIHRPDPRQRAAWEPILRGRVDLVLQGHNHDYERLRVAGTTYLTTGGGGAPVYPCLFDVPGLRVCLPVHEFLDVTVRRDRIDVRAIGEDGRVIDRVSVPARAAGAH